MWAKSRGLSMLFRKGFPVEHVVNAFLNQCTQSEDGSVLRSYRIKINEKKTLNEFVPLLSNMSEQNEQLKHTQYRRFLIKRPYLGIRLEKIISRNPVEKCPISESN